MNTVIKSRKHTRKLVGMVYRKQGNDNVIRIEINGLARRGNNREYILLAEHYALTRSRSARGKQELGNFLSLLNRRKSVSV